MHCAYSPVQSQASFCATYQPVFWTSKDSRKTKEMIDSNNAVWKALCSGGK